MPRPLFVYGTLMFDEVQRVVIGRVLRSEPAVLPGYARRCVRGQPYPAVRPDVAETTTGRLCHNVGVPTLRRLDHYEGHLYDRRTLPVVTDAGDEVLAEVYVLADAHRRVLSDRPWDRDAFARIHLRPFLRAIRRTFAPGGASAPGTRP